MQSSAKEVIPGETSQAQRNRVQKLYVYSFHASNLANLTRNKNPDKGLKMRVGSKTRKNTATRKVVAGEANTMIDNHANHLMIA